MLTITINGNIFSVEPGTTVLQAVRKANVDLPTLCHLEGLPPYGACRLCMVEVQAPTSAVIAACSYPVEDGMVVDTQGEKAISIRKVMLEFMLARCPESSVIQDLAAQAGLNGTRFTCEPVGRTDAPGSELCILCGLCVRVCRDMVGAAAIGFNGRGDQRVVGAPFFMQADACIGCTACAAVCPTQAIHIEDHGGKRYLHTWNTVVELQPCPVCGKPSSPEPMIFLKGLAEASENLWGICPDCRRKQTAVQSVSVLG